MIGEETGTARGKMPEEYPSTKTGRSSHFTAAHKRTIVIHTTNIARSPYIAFGSLVIVLAVPPPEALLPRPHTGCFVAHKTACHNRHVPMCGNTEGLQMEMGGNDTSI